MIGFWADGLNVLNENSLPAASLLFITYFCVQRKAHLRRAFEVTIWTRDASAWGPSTGIDG